MQTKTIDKLEDLKGYKWEYNEKYFKIAHLKLYVQPAQPEIHGLNLIQINALDFQGNSQDETIRRIGENNLIELEFYGLKVILNKKPKLTEKEHKLVESFDMFYEDDIFLVRYQNNVLCIYEQEPHFDEIIKSWESNDISNGSMLIKENFFKFITWESGKAWSKSELMELEVVE